jgi:FkbM family methyltransferase
MLLGVTKISLRKINSPIYLRRKSSDLLTFHQIFTFKEYDMNLGFVPQFVVDAGANIGLSAVFFSNKFPGVKIVAIEPEKANFKMLEINTKDYENIVLAKNALSNCSNVSFDVVDKGYGNWGFITEIEDSKNTSKVVDTVKTITIDDIFSNYNLEYLDLLKIDIEGGEKQLFESNYENWLPKTKCIIIELHDGSTKGSSKSFFKAISKYDFSYFNRGENLLFINNTLKL